MLNFIFYASLYQKIQYPDASVELVVMEQF